MGPKVDESVEICRKSPDVNLETGVDVSVVGNIYRKKFAPPKNPTALRVTLTQQLLRLMLFCQFS